LIGAAADEFGGVRRLAPDELVGERAEGGSDVRCDDVEPEGVAVAETRADVVERIGFMEAPELGPPNMASSPTVPPTAIAAASPTARLSVATAVITNMRMTVMTGS
jgi:hypothetical protein